MRRVLPGWFFGRVGGFSFFGGLSRSVLSAGPAGVVVLILIVGLVLSLGPLSPAAPAATAPSAELSFRAAIRPDSITVGDPIVLTLEAAGPEGAALTLPVLADSVGPFSVLSADPPVTEVKGGRLRVRQTAKVTLFRAGPSTFPELMLLWVRAPEESLVAYSQAMPVKVRSVLTKQIKGLEDLHGVKGVVALGKPRWGLYALILALAAGLGFLLWRFRRRLRRRGLRPEIPLPPPLPPDVAFERGLEALYKQRLPELGRIKEFYAELSLLFRRYIEDRFGFPAVEETRTEVMLAAQKVPELEDGERRSLGAWLEEGDLVKFAKMERLLQESMNYAERAREWVKRTASSRRSATEAASPGSPSLGSPSPGAPSSSAADPEVQP